MEEARPRSLEHRPRRTRRRFRKASSAKCSWPEATEASPLQVFLASDAVWYRRGWFFLLLSAAGLAALLFLLLLVLQGQVFAYFWVGASLLAAGWIYHDAELSHRVGLFWGPFVLLLGPFGLAIYLLSRQ